MRIFCSVTKFSYVCEKSQTFTIMKRFISAITVSAFIAAVSSSCGGSKGAGDYGDVPTIDWAQGCATKVIDLHDFADIEYVPLETNDSCLIQYATQRAVSDSFIVVGDAFQGRIHVFDRKGRHLRSFGRKGGGPEEYQYMLDVVTDFDNSEVLVYDLKNNRFVRFGLDGKFRGVTNAQIEGKLDNVSNFDATYMIARDGKDLSLQPLEENKEPYRYILINKQTGEIKRLPFAAEHPMGYSMTWEMEGGAISLAFPISQVSSMGSGAALISDISKDTVYQYAENSLKPLFAFKNVDRKSNVVPDLPTVALVAGNNVFVDYMRVTDINQNGSEFDEDMTHMYLFNMADGSLSKVDIKRPYLKDGGDNSQALYRTTQSTDGSTIAVPLQMEKLVEALDNDNLADDVKALVEGRSEEANPVIMLIKFRK